MRSRSHAVQSMGLASARSIGILFNAKDEHTFKIIREFADHLRAGGLRNIRSLGFVPKKEVAAFLQSSPNFDFFTRDDLNWYHRPQGKQVIAFMDQKFDILIDLRSNRSVALLFLVGLSNAHFKVGRYGEGHEEFYDLMIDVNEKSEMSYVIEQMNHYLTMLDGGSSQSS